MLANEVGYHYNETMTQIKICPDCKTEYFPHIGRCADCGAVLLTPEENKKIQEEKQRCMDEIPEDTVVVREGSLTWMDELYNVLIGSNISCAVTTDAGCKKGCCGSTYRLLVSSEDAEKASERIEEHCALLHPELKASREMMGRGQCPACSSPVSSDAVECPDCGLTLLIIE
ncbi:MAG: hypothetical protein HZA16_00600 [Nitrospirae bacterium]|nr:hypothetical protein [Nitrospirota bacterium]